MLLEQLRTRLRTEYKTLRLYLTTAKLTAEDILNRAYEILWKEEIMNLFEVMTETNSRYSDELLLWILSKENSLEFLYGVWQHTAYLLTDEFSTLLLDELLIRKDGCNE